jgi:hypothetical protein
MNVGPKVETEVRVAVVQRMLCEGYTRSQIATYAQETWGISKRSTDRLCASARVQIVKDLNVSRETYCAEKLSTVEHLASEALRAKDYHSAGRALRLIVEMAGLLPVPERRNRSGQAFR